ncbi:UNKNOWN [Stylonychia lemnae]|uniref:Uncharacterized protein n=1 Tax=Stylonychia lemnae TaxID=5949 RepID=A0A077ZR19_STYLE|nr:UNKNOWN [Stylonychia lemnae]|eukprot:CDW71800.1 UNKNOWN [Stylonychia lemnae]
MTNIDDSYLSHRRKKMIEHRDNHDSQLSVRSLTRSLTRANRKNSSRPSSQQSSKQESEENLNQQVPTTQILINNNANHHLNVSQGEETLVTGKADNSNIIEEQDQEETIGDEVVMKTSTGQMVQAQVKQGVITMDMLLELQNSKKANTKNSDRNDDFIFPNSQYEKPLTDSWEKSIKETTRSFIGDLLFRFKPTPSFQPAKSDQNDTDIKDTSEINLNKNSSSHIQSQSNYGIETTVLQSIDHNIINQDSVIRINDSSILELQSIGDLDEIDKISKHEVVLEDNNDFQGEYKEGDLYEDKLGEVTIEEECKEDLDQEMKLVELSETYANQTLLSLVNEILQETENQLDADLEEQLALNLVSKVESTQIEVMVCSTIEDILNQVAIFVTQSEKPSHQEEFQSPLSLKYQSGVKNEPFDNFLDVSFNQLSQQQDNHQAFIDMSFQDNNQKKDQSSSENLEIDEPIQHQYIDTEQDEKALNLTEDALDLLFYYIIKEEFKQSLVKSEKDTEDQVVRVTMYRLEDQIIEETMTSHIEDLKQDMYEKFLDKICMEAQNKVIQRIVHEFLLLYELGSSDNAANFIVDLVEDKMIDRVVDFLDKEESLEDLRRHSNASELRSAGSQKRISQVENQNYLNDQIMPQQFIVKKKKKIRRSKSPGNRTKNQSEVQVENLLDIDFFEKCFFGKKLHMKDQIIFKIYANELLEIIKSNFTTQMKKKYKNLVNNRKTRKAKRAFEKYDQSPDLNRTREHIKAQLMMTPQKQIRKSLTPGNNLNRNNSSQLISLDIVHGNVKVGQTFSADDPFRDQNQTIPQSSHLQINEFSDQHNTMNNSSQQNNQDQNRFNKLQENQLEDQKPQVNTYFINVKDEDKYTTGDQYNMQQVAQSMSISSKPVSSSQQENNTSISMRSRKKRQPSQLRDLTPDTNFICKINDFKTLIAPKSPPRQQQVKIYQNLENQIKDILKFNKNSNQNLVKQIKIKRRGMNNQSEKVSPNRNTLQSSKAQSRELPALKKPGPKYRIQNYISNTMQNSDNETLEQQYYQVQNQNYLSEAPLNFAFQKQTNSSNDQRKMNQTLQHDDNRLQNNVLEQYNVNFKQLSNQAQLMNQTMIRRKRNYQRAQSLTKDILDQIRPISVNKRTIDIKKVMQKIQMRKQVNMLNATQILDLDDSSYQKGSQRPFSQVRKRFQTPLNQTMITNMKKRDSRVVLNSDKYHLQNTSVPDYSSNSNINAINTEKLNQQLKRNNLQNQTDTTLGTYAQLNQDNVNNQTFNKTQIKRNSTQIQNHEQLFGNQSSFNGATEMHLTSLGNFDNKKEELLIKQQKKVQRIQSKNAYQNIQSK